MASKTLPPSPKITMANGHQMMIKLSSVMMAALPLQLIKLKMAQPPLLSKLWAPKTVVKYQWLLTTKMAPHLPNLHHQKLMPTMMAL